jgi:hypothetical protein
MPRNDFEFQPALPYPIKWSTGENSFDEDGKFPQQLALAIPVKSIPAFCDYLMSLGDTNDKIKTGKVWDFSKKEEVEVDVVWINAKGKDGTTRNGAFGNINPQKTEAQRQAQDGRRSSSEEIPF